MPVNKKSMATGKTPTKNAVNADLWSRGAENPVSKQKLVRGKGKGQVAAKKADVKTQVKSLRNMSSEFPEMLTGSGKLKKVAGVPAKNQDGKAVRRINKAAAASSLGASRKKK